MEHHNSLSSPNIAVGGLTGFSCQGDITKPPLRYYNMSVQETRSPRSAYLSQSNANKNSTHPISLLNEFRIKPLMQTIPDSFDEFNLSVTSESIHDEYSPRNPDKESIEDALFPSLGSDLCDQPLFSGHEPDLSEPTPSIHLNLNHHLTNLPANLSCPQDSRPVAVANPLNLQQGTNDNPANSTEIVGDKYSQVEHKKKCCKNPVYSELEKARKKLRYHNDPDYAKRLKERKNHRYQKDSIYAECRRIYNKTYSKMKRKVSKEEASRLASIARAEFLQLVNSSEGSVDLPLTLKSTQTTQNSNKNVYILPRLPSQAD